MLKELRKARGLSQEKLAQESGLTLKSIQGYENQGVMPRIDNAHALADALSRFGAPVSVDDLFEAVSA